MDRHEFEQKLSGITEAKSIKGGKLYHSIHVDKQKLFFTRQGKSKVENINIDKLYQLYQSYIRGIDINTPVAKKHISKRVQSPAVGIILKLTSRIVMGNDEFILYVRKHNINCVLNNDQLGKLIWEWIRACADGEKKAIENCLWEKSTHTIIHQIPLPNTATQFEFDRKKLPHLYSYLETL
jgi:hypothetical protein